MPAQVQNKLPHDKQYLSCLMTKPTKWQPSEDSDQPGQSPSLIRIFTEHSFESSLGAHAILLVLSWSGSNIVWNTHLGWLYLWKAWKKEVSVVAGNLLFMKLNELHVMFICLNSRVVRTVWLSANTGLSRGQMERYCPCQPKVWSR